MPALLSQQQAAGAVQPKPAARESSRSKVAQVLPMQRATGSNITSCAAFPLTGHALPALGVCTVVAQSIERMEAGQRNAPWRLFGSSQV